jgi:rhodanese-related sulfurtransferase
MTVSVITENIMVTPITATELADLMGRDGVVLIDVRDHAEWESGHLAGSRCIPLETLREDPDRHLTHGTTIVFVCKKGVRSIAAAKLADRFGYEKVYNLEGGTLEWSRVGYPLDAPERAAA